jgi:hypothetical protein
VRCCPGAASGKFADLDRQRVVFHNLAIHEPFKMARA